MEGGFALLAEAHRCTSSFNEALGGCRNAHHQHGAAQPCAERGPRELAVSSSRPYEQAAGALASCSPLVNPSQFTGSVHTHDLHVHMAVNRRRKL